MSRIDVKLAEGQQLDPEEIQILSEDAGPLRITDEQIEVVAAAFAQGRITGYNYCWRPAQGDEAAD